MCVWHDSSGCVISGIYIYFFFLTHIDVCVTWLIWMCDIWHFFVWHDVFICVDVVFVTHLISDTVTTRSRTVCCSTLQHTATHCNTLQHTAPHYNTLQHISDIVTICLCTVCCSTLQHTSTHCNTLQHTAPHCTTSVTLWRFVYAQYVAARCNTLQHTATHCNILQRTATHCNTSVTLRRFVHAQCVAAHCNTLQHTATHCNTLQYTTTHYNKLQHTATHCNTLQHVSDIVTTYLCTGHDSITSVKCLILSTTCLPCHDSSKYVTWLIRTSFFVAVTSLMLRMDCLPLRIQICDRTLPNMCHDSFIHGTSFFVTCDITHVIGLFRRIQW